ncbi:autophagy protein [Kockovaella imperatae]|uniref:Autophagy-related protein n=1 Tax=Kockovaella imperatae TaxID=4999 RepID=A0A1Y1UBF0_9TREE|nr:autophagy protein [Kockovaella imperatae]ORX34854.1 autophagy protein [Kockovaella imperatae]
MSTGILPVVENVDEKHDDSHLESAEIKADDVILGDDLTSKVPHSAGLAVIEQRRAIPLAGKRQVATKWEYWTFVLFFLNSNASPIGGPGGNIRQATLTLSHPDGFMNWAGARQPVNTVLLDISGILTAVTVVVMFVLGPYADYGNWRPWIMIGAEVITWGCEFGMMSIKDVSQWQTANVLWALGGIALTIVGAFYQATYPSMVRDLPKMIQSEEDVLHGLKSPEEHEKLDAYERAKIFNWCNIWGSFGSVVVFGIGIAVSKAVGFADTSALLHAYRVLMAYYTPIAILVTVPYFICMKWRPAQQVPSGYSMWTVGPRQVIYAGKSIVQLKQCLLYLCAYVFLFEAIGAFLSIYFILQLETIHYNPVISTAFNLVGDLCGGAGCAVILYLHRRYDWKVKWIMFVSAIFSLFPCLWGALGSFTHKIGFHNVWEFWFMQVWNLVTSACSSYNVTMISEVAPATKLFMFYSLFNTISKSTGFAGPFITAAIIKQSHGNNNYAFWFLVGLGIIAIVLLYFVDTDKAKIDCAVCECGRAGYRISLRV